MCDSNDMSRTRKSIQIESRLVVVRAKVAGNKEIIAKGHGVSHSEVKRIDCAIVYMYL